MREFLTAKIPLVALASWCVAMLVVRTLYSGDSGYDFLFWNLALAIVPVIASGTFAALAVRPGTIVLRVVAFLVWVAFLPNAPYLVTDYVHLTHASPVPYWYDIALFGSFAATGAVLGYASVAEIESVLRRRLGPLWASMVSAGVLLLCGFGIYVGRFMRFNSWDVLTAPRTLGHQVAHQVVNPSAHPASWEVPTVYGIGLVLGYLALRSVAPLFVTRDPADTRQPEQD